MNTQTLLELVKRRVTGYQDAEYLSELNDAYIDIWERVLRLDNNWYEATSEVTVSVAQARFDLLFNTDSGLDATVNPLLHTIQRIRILSPNVARWDTAIPQHKMQARFLRRQAASPQVARSGGPYYYRITAKGTIEFAEPLVVSTKIEVMYTYSPVPLKILSAGTVSSAAKVVTGTSTFFTDLLEPDLKAQFQTGVADFGLQVEAELVSVARTYRADLITNDTSLTTFVAPSPALSGESFTLSVVPDLPPAHHRVIASVATRNLFSTPADDSRFGEWAAIAEKHMEAMNAALGARQEQANPKKRPFRYKPAAQSIVLTST